MIAQLVLIAAAAGLAAVAFLLAVKHANRRGVGVVARTFNGRIYFLDTAILDDAMFVPHDYPDDPLRLYYRFDNRLVTEELIHRYARVLGPTAFVKISGLVDGA